MNQNYTEIKELRASAVLTTSYVAATVHGPQGGSTANDPVENNQLVLLIELTLGSLTSVEVKVEFSDDNSTYYQETASLITAGTSADSPLIHQFDEDGNYRLPIPLVDRNIKVSVKGTGTVTNSLVSVKSVLAIRA